MSTSDESGVIDRDTIGDHDLEIRNQHGVIGRDGRTVHCINCDAWTDDNEHYQVAFQAVDCTGGDGR